MRRRVAAVVLALVGVVGLSQAGVTPAQAAKPSAPKAKPQYVALGDSYAAGVGLTPYSNETCDRSATKAYPTLLAGKKLGLTFTACTGATTETLIDTQLVPVPDVVKYVTVTIGGNDLGFAEILSDCVARLGATDGCTDTTKTNADAALDALPTKLTTVLEAVKAAYPNATVYASGYPVMLGANFTGGRCVVGNGGWFVGDLWINEDDAPWLNTTATRLNDAIKAAAEAEGAKYADAAATFSGHARCDTGTPWVNGVILDGFQASERSFHPTADGQKLGYKAAFINAGFPAA